MGLIQSFEAVAKPKGWDLSKRDDGSYHRAGTRQAFYLFRDGFEAGERHERRQVASRALANIIGER